MKQDLIIYHGSQEIIRIPIYKGGKIHNDYGPGFYCTRSLEMAKEWACSVKRDGYANRYILHLEDLKVMDLTKGGFNILSWLAILLANRTFSTRSPVGNAARDFLLSRFLPDTRDVDVMIGWRADDSYFAFAEDFINNTLSLRDLDRAMRLGNLEEQIVLLSPKAFSQIEFTGYEIAPFAEYYYKREDRDKSARASYANQKKNLQQLAGDLFVLDIIREDMRNGDARLQSALSF